MSISQTQNNYDESPLPSKQDILHAEGESGIDIILTSQGKLEVYRSNLKNKKCSRWTGLVDFVASKYVVVGLTKEGTVKVDCTAMETMLPLILDLQSWHGVTKLYRKEWLEDTDQDNVYISTNRIYGVTYDGHIKCVEYRECSDYSKGSGRNWCECSMDCEVKDYDSWTNIVALGMVKSTYVEEDVPDHVIIAIDENGYVYHSDANSAMKACDVQMFYSLSNLMMRQEAEEQYARSERMNEENRRMENRRQKRCQYCGGAFSGFFKKKCSQCKIEKDY